MKQKTLWIVAAFSVGTLFATLIFRYFQGGPSLQKTDGFWGSDSAGQFSIRTGGAGPRGFEVPASIVMPSVVSIDTLQEQYAVNGQVFIAPTAEGSGVILSQDGTIVTNHHVIQNADLVRVHVNDHQSGPRVFEAKIIGMDAPSDLAVLKINAKNLTPIKIGSSKKLQIGEWVIAIGNSLGYENTLSAGVVSSLGRTLPTKESVLVNAIQTDAPINPGNSGGALANTKGELVGINTAIATPSQGSVGIGFAIPVDRMQRVVDDILKYGHVRYGWFGMSVFPPEVFAYQVNRARLESFLHVKLPDHGLVIQNVYQNSPAAAAGLKRYDVLLSIDNRPMNTLLDYISLEMDKRPGDKVQVLYWSLGTEKTAEFVLSSLPRRQKS